VYTSASVFNISGEINARRHALCLLVPVLLDGSVTVSWKREGWVIFG